MKFRRKALAALMALVLLTAGFSVAAAAGNHHGRSRTNLTLCAVSNCNTVGTHTHNGRRYAGHTIGDGHGYHRPCNVRSCTQTQAHRHGNATCLPQPRGTGRCCR